MVFNSQTLIIHSPGGHKQLIKKALLMEGNWSLQFGGYFL